jgi:hypothetical protein
LCWSAIPVPKPQSAIRLGRIGFDHVIGYLDGGLASAQGSAARIAATERLMAAPT